MTDLDATSGGEPHPQYMIFLLVFFFFLTGLLGFLICHMLKKKGYRCRTGDLEEEEECKDKLAPDDGPEENQDTVEQILKCIIENEANMEAFKEMLGNQNPCEHNVASRLPRKESLGGCPRTTTPKVRPGEQTVFSVGRFRVTHMEKKNSLQGSPNLPAKESVDHSDNTEPLDDQEDPAKSQEGYNLRNMFKQVSPTNGVVAVETKRKKSVTLFPPWKSSEPAAAAKEAPGNSGGGGGRDGSGHRRRRRRQRRLSRLHRAAGEPRPAAGRGHGHRRADRLGDGGGQGRGGTGGQGRGGRGGGGQGRPERGGRGRPSPAPARMRHFSVVRTGQRAEEAAMPGEFGRDDMVEMEDIKDCRVSLEEDSRPSWEEKRRSVHTQHKCNDSGKGAREGHVSTWKHIHTQPQDAAFSADAKGTKQNECESK
ncbi:hypothetical protein ANANG_G00055620 [Anguilla anguilla]|uniref:RELT like 2 n=1 Tax=Anguilla anguilla TaxID=7936 RepID=A0A9D3MMX8_ANGAN|nr:hypothetical protein ANANG_G00055620 [Anguilla anguilla]